MVRQQGFDKAACEILLVDGRCLHVGVVALVKGNSNAKVTMDCDFQPHRVRWTFLLSPFLFFLRDALCVRECRTIAPPSRRVIPLINLLPVSACCPPCEVIALGCPALRVYRSDVLGR